MSQPEQETSSKACVLKIAHVAVGQDLDLTGLFIPTWLDSAQALGSSTRIMILSSLAFNPKPKTLFAELLNSKPSSLNFSPDGIAHHEPARAAAHPRQRLRIPASHIQDSLRIHKTVTTK